VRVKAETVEPVRLGLVTSDGYVRTWGAQAASDWAVSDVGTLAAAVGRGGLARADADDGHFDEIALLDQTAGALVLIADSQDPQGLQPVTVTVPLTRVEAATPWTEDNVRGFQAWLEAAIRSAAERNEAVVIDQHVDGTVRRIECHPFAVPTGEDAVALDATPSPADHPIWQGKRRRLLPPDPQVFARAAALAIDVLITWPGGPLDLRVRYGRAGEITVSTSPHSTAPRSFHGRDGDLVVDGQLSGPLTYALAHNGVPLVHSLRITNVGSSDLGMLDVTARVEAALELSPVHDLHTTDPAPRPGTRTDILGSLIPDPRALVTVEELTRATLTLTVSSSAGPRVTIEHPVDVLAYNQWVGGEIMYDALAAFVMPRHPAVREVLGAASDLLLERTGDSALQGYQAGPRRADDIAAAVYEALRSRGIRYSDPPASFEQAQKVRTPEEVLDDRFGTCLDTTVVYAACLEEAGLRPVLFLVEGHAFSGYMRHEGGLPDTVVRDGNVMVTLVESERVVPVETTTVTTGEMSKPFDDAVRSARRRVRTDVATLRALVDVAQVRRSVKPLPARRLKGGVVEIHHTAEPASPPNGHARQPDPAGPQGREERAVSGTADRPAQTGPARIEKWKTALLDLTLRNPLLNFKPGKSGVDLHIPSDTLHAFEDLVASGHRIRLHPVDKLQEMHLLAGARSAQDLDRDTTAGYLFDQKLLFTQLDEKEYLSRLRTLRRKARALEEETGANHLFLTLGELHWNEARDGSGRQLRSPLLLQPMRLDGGAKGKPYFRMHVEEGSYASPNYSLLEKLRLSFGLEVPELATPLTDDAGIDIDAVLAAVRTALVEAELPFRVDETCHLGLLAFTNFRLWKDLDEHHEIFLRNPVVRHLVDSPDQAFTDPAGQDAPALDELDLACPVPADGSQMHAISWALAGRSFVLEGPPGTGKSQTITNLIANLLDRGKSVLFVAEKAAALDVVQRRLDSVGLAPRCLNLHGKDQSPAQVRAQIKTSLDHSVDPNRQLWDVTRSRVGAAVRSLTAYATALHEPNGAGTTFWDAHQTELALGDGPAADVPATFVIQHAERIADLRDRLVDLPTTLAAAGDPDSHPWRLAALTLDRLPADQELGALVEGLGTALQEVEARSGVLAPLVRSATNSGTLRDLASAVGPLSGAQLPSANELTMMSADRSWVERIEALTRRVHAFGDSASPSRSLLTPSAFGLDLDGLLREAREASGKLLGRKRRMAAIASVLHPHLRAGATLEGADLVALLSAAIVDRAQVKEMDAEVAGRREVLLPAGWSAADDGAAAVLQAAFEASVAAIRLAEHVPGAMDALSQRSPQRVDPELGSALLDLVTAWEALTDALRADPGRVAALLDGRPLIDALEHAVPVWAADGRDSHFLQLRRWATLGDAIIPLVEAGLTGFAQALITRQISAHDADAAFQRGVARASKAERAASTGLAHFDAHQHVLTSQRYVSDAAYLREQMISMLPARIAGHHATDPLGALGREVGKTRSRLSVRALIERHGRQIQQVTPCFLMSPDSVARYSPPGVLDFDVVVFDEASQLKVAEAVGALGRGKAAVVVGDSRQMPPTSVADTAIDDEEDDLVESLVIPVDEESILSECVAAGLPRRWLSWHYRSRDESLIAFSNVTYYEGRLSSFPTPGAGDGNTGVQLRYVDGVFERGKARVNRAEADAIVEEIRRRLNDPLTSDQTIGVVTFNTQQRDLISTMLESLDDPAVAEALDGAPADRLFVKNLENVQGDERDVILFSLAFSRDPATDRLPLNFGPLNKSGGERRLNVAITRARSLVLLFASFRPSDIDPAKTSSKGLQDLRHYLELAAADAAGTAAVLGRPQAGRDLHREQVAEALRKRGLRVETEVGLSDFTVDIAVGLPEVESWRLAVLLDSPAWARRATVADRDGFPLEVLAGPMGWPSVARVWLPSWLVEREAVLDQLECQVREAVPAVPEPEPAPEVVKVTVPEIELPPSVEPLGETAGAPSSFRRPAPPTPVTPAPAPAPQRGQTAFGCIELVPYRPADEAPRGPRSMLDLITPADRAAVRAALEDAVVAEGPIESGRLVRLVARQFDLSRVRDERYRSILRLLPSSWRRSSPLGTFAWPPQCDPDTWRVVRTQLSFAERPLDEIPPEELRNAVLTVLHDRGGEEDWETVLRESVGYFGYTRLTSPVRARMDVLRSWAVDRGDIVNAGATSVAVARQDGNTEDAHV
jgi:hypothetical protein